MFYDSIERQVWKEVETGKESCRTKEGKVFSSGAAIVEPPLDRRIQRTRQLLRDALFVLIMERGYAGIAIQDITEQANLGRTTFYLHYRDKEELLLASVQALLQELQFEVEPDAAEVCPYLVRCVRIFQHVAPRRQLYQALLRESGPLNIRNLLEQYFTALFQRYFLVITEGEDFAKTTGELVAAHAAGSLLSLLSWWFRSEVLLAAEEMGAIYFRLVSQGSQALLAQPG